MLHKILKTVAFVWCLTMACAAVNAQDVREHLNRGDRAYEKKDYNNALLSFLEALKGDPDNPHTNYKIGISYFQGKQKTKALAFLEKAYHSNPEITPEIDYHLGMAYQHNYQFSQAAKHYEKFKVSNKKLSAVLNQKIKECLVGDSLMRVPASADIQNFGSSVNSSFAESAPLLAADGQSMIFTSNRAADEYEIKSKTNFDDILITYKQGAEWSTPQKLSPVLNTKYNDAAASLSHDEKTLFVYYENGEGDIYTSTLENGTWLAPIPLNKFINNPLYREGSACLSPDGQKLYFTSNRPGGRGGFDIYVSQRDIKGQWGRPSNLGSTINTRGNEESPFIHHDGVTLYFSSNGHPGLGDNDIFKSELKDTKWTKPENLGYPINSTEHDGFFTMSADKTTGYFSGLREGGLGGTDLYLVRFKATSGDLANALATAVAEEESDGQSEADFIDPVVNAQMEKNIFTKLKGTVLDIVTSQPISATVSLVDNNSNRKLAKITTGANGYFEVSIPHGGNYGLTTEKAGYLFHSINFNLPEALKYKEVETSILMEKLNVGSKIILKNIFFDVGKSALEPASLTELRNIRNLLSQNANLRVQINGHTDNTGHEATNLVLSLKRAEAVVDYLVTLGIEKSRVEAKGFGSARPLVSNDDESDGRQINRRTEIEVIKSNE